VINCIEKEIHLNSSSIWHSIEINQMEENVMSDFWRGWLAGVIGAVSGTIVGLVIMELLGILKF